MKSVTSKSVSSKGASVEHGVHSPRLVLDGAETKRMNHVDLTALLAHGEELGCTTCRSSSSC